MANTTLKSCKKNANNGIWAISLLINDLLFWQVGSQMASAATPVASETEVAGVRSRIFCEGELFEFVIALGDMGAVPCSG